MSCNKTDWVLAYFILDHWHKSVAYNGFVDFYWLYRNYNTHLIVATIILFELHVFDTWFLMAS